MTRALLFLGMVGFACLLAAGFGAYHNQISYWVGPDYFHGLKFAQFRVPAHLHDHAGAALVGVQASWWMGLIIGPPLALLCLFFPSYDQASRGFVGAGVIVILVTLLLGKLSLAFAPPMQLIPIPSGIADPTGFARAALMHEVSYLGGGIGLVVALVYVIRKVRHARRSA